MPVIEVSINWPCIIDATGLPEEFTHVPQWSPGLCHGRWCPKSRSAAGECLVAVWYVSLQNPQTDPSVSVLMYHHIGRYLCISKLCSRFQNCWLKIFHFFSYMMWFEINIKKQTLSLSIATLGFYREPKPEVKIEVKSCDVKPDMPPPPSPDSSTCSDHSGPTLISTSLSKYLICTCR